MADQHDVPRIALSLPDTVEESEPSRLRVHAPRALVRAFEHEEGTT